MLLMNDCLKEKQESRLWVLGLEWVSKKLSVLQDHFHLVDTGVKRTTWLSTQIPWERKNLGLAGPRVHSFIQQNALSISCMPRTVLGAGIHIDMT